MFIRICLLSALVMGALAGPAMSDDGAIVVAQLQRFITPKKIHVRPAALPCPNYFAAC
jgi:hypothetical protein